MSFKDRPDHQNSATPKAFERDVEDEAQTAGHSRKNSSKTVLIER